MVHRVDKNAQSYLGSHCELIIDTPYLIQRPDFFAFVLSKDGQCEDMGQDNDLTSEKIAAITSLVTAGQFNKEIAIITRVSLRSVQRWTKKFFDCGQDDVTLQKKCPGKQWKTSPHTLNTVY